jgi:cytoskeletal protein RodZ
MSSIGDALRGERLRRGIMLEQVAAETKIGVPYLIAMEEERFDQIGLGSFFKRNFLRQYARVLGLDEEELVSLFNQQFETNVAPEPEPEPPPSVFHLPSMGTRLWALAVLACIGTYRLDQSGWFSSFRPKTSAVSPSMALADPVKSKPRQTAQPQRNPPGEADRAIATDPETLSRGSRPIRVELRATEPVWLSIKADGVFSYSGTLETQQNKRIDALTKMSVLVGNAGGLEVLMNGKPIGPVGTHGEVLSLEFTPEGFHVVRGVKTPPPTPEEPVRPKDEALGRNRAMYSSDLRPI